MTATAYKNRSAEEPAMRELIVPKLRAGYPSARIIHELPLRYSESRIDLAAVTEDSIVGVEIKSSRDTLTRLRHQVEGFAPICSLVIIALAPKWNTKLPDYEEHVPPSKAWPTGYVVSRHQYTEAQDIIRSLPCNNTETWTVCHETGTVERTRGHSEKSHPWLARCLHLLHVEELRQICEDHRIAFGKRATHEVLWKECADLMTGREIKRAVCKALRARSGFAKESDPPIVLEAA